MNKPKISVALCTYNGERYLGAQLDSIAAQKRKPDEVIICDDGSQDETLDLVHKFIATATYPVHLVRNPSRLGSTANFANAINLCSGEIVVLTDQDDIWSSQKLEHIEAYFTAHEGKGGVFSDGELIDQNGLPIGKSLWEAVSFSLKKQSNLEAGKGFDELFSGNFVTGATLAFRSSWKKLILPIPEGWIHDYWIAVLISGVSQLGFSNKKLIQYRCHGGQQLGVRQKKGMLAMWRQYGALDKAAFLAEAANWEMVKQRLQYFEFDSKELLIQKCKIKILHARARASLPQDYMRRIPCIIREVLNYNYFRYSAGFKSILRDLFSR